MNDCFIKAGRRLGNKGSLWALDAAYTDMYQYGSAKRRKSRVIEGREDKYRKNRKSKKIKQVDGKSKSSTKESQVKVQEKVQHTADLQLNNSDSSSQQTSLPMSANDGFTLQTVTDLASSPVPKGQIIHTLPSLNCENIEWKSLTRELQSEHNVSNASSAVEVLQLNPSTSGEQSGKYNLISQSNVELSEQQVQTETQVLSTGNQIPLLLQDTSTSRTAENDSKLPTKENTNQKEIAIDNTAIPNLKSNTESILDKIIAIYS